MTTFSSSSSFQSGDGLPKNLLFTAITVVSFFLSMATQTMDHPRLQDSMAIFRYLMVMVILLLIIIGDLLILRCVGLALALFSPHSNSVLIAELGKDSEEERRRNCNPKLHYRKVSKAITRNRYEQISQTLTPTRHGILHRTLNLYIRET